MIPRSRNALRVLSWRDELREAYRTPLDLLTDLDLTPAAVDLSEAAATAFAFRVTRPFAARMRPGDARDPLLLQVLPSTLETAATAGFSDDPVGEFGLGNGSALLQKYAGRGLLLMTGACAINCRYCFRRAYPYADHAGSAALETGLAAINTDPSIAEVILSGGDPLLLDDARLAGLVARLAPMQHVRRLRIHTRLPLVLPQRMTDALLELLRPGRFHTTLVIHSNHPQELDEVTLNALARGRDRGIVMLNQSVLLRGVNDDAGVLAALSEKLFSAGVLPYYLHQLDRVAGTAHFAVSDLRARELAASLRSALPGYLVPQLVREIAGAGSKTPLVSAMDTPPGA